MTPLLRLRIYRSCLEWYTERNATASGEIIDPTGYVAELQEKIRGAEERLFREMEEEFRVFMGGSPSKRPSV